MAELMAVGLLGPRLDHDPALEDGPGPSRRARRGRHLPAGRVRHLGSTTVVVSQCCSLAHQVGAVEPALGAGARPVRTLISLRDSRAPGRQHESCRTLASRSSRIRAEDRWKAERLSELLAVSAEPGALARHNFRGQVGQGRLLALADVVLNHGGLAVAPQDHHVPGMEGQRRLAGRGDEDDVDRLFQGS